MNAFSPMQARIIRVQWPDVLLLAKEAWPSYICVVDS